MKRERVVLAERRGARIVRTRTEVQEHTEVGEAMVRGLVRAQLALAVRIGLVVVVVLGAVPLLTTLVPGLAEVAVFGVRLPWLILGVAAYPVLIVAGWSFVRSAARNEHEFTDLVDD